MRGNSRVYPPIWWRLALRLCGALALCLLWISLASPTFAQTVTCPAVTGVNTNNTSIYQRLDGAACTTGSGSVGGYPTDGFFLQTTRQSGSYQIFFGAASPSGMSDLGFSCAAGVPIFSGPSIFGSLGIVQITSSDSVHECSLSYTVGGSDTRTIPITISAPAGQAITMGATSFSLGGAVLDTTPPALDTVTLTPAQAGPGTEVVATLGFDEALAAAPQLSLQGQAMAVTGSGTDWVGRVTISAGSFTDGAAALAISGVADAAGNAANAIPSAASVTLDVTGPQGSATISPAIARAGQIVTLDLSFNEALSAPPSVLIGGETATVSGSGQSYQASLSIPLSMAEGPAAVTVTGQDALGNAVAFASLPSLTIDNTPPSVSTASISPDNVRDGQEVVAQITYSEALISAPSMTLGGVAMAVSGSGTTWTGRVTPTAGGFPEGNLAFVASGGADAAGNGATGQSGFFVVADFTAPSLAFDAAPATISGPITLTLRADEPVTGLDLNDFSVTGPVTLSALTGGPSVYQAVLTPSANGAFSVSVGNGAAQDAAGNTTPAPAGLAGSIDLSAPQILAISRNSPSESVTNADTLIWRVSFSESVSAITADDFSLTGSSATLSVSSASGSEVLVTASGGDLANVNGSVTLGLASGQNIVDGAGNQLDGVNLPASPQSYSLDNLVPQSISMTLTPASPGLGQVVTARLEVSEALAQNPVLQFQGQTMALSVLGLVYEGQITIGNSLSTGTAALSISGGADAAGNALQINGALPSIYIDPEAPDPLLEAITPSPTNAAQIVLEANFREAVTGFDASDVVASLGGTALPVTVTDLGGERFRLTLDMAGAGSGTVSVSLPAGAASDLAGNASLASTVVSLSYDATRPVVAMTSPQAGSFASGLLEVRITVSEPVVNLLAAAPSLVIANGVITASRLAGAQELVVDVTPNAAGQVTVSVPSGWVSDTLGNASTSTPSLAREYAPDLTPPTASFDPLPNVITGATSVTIRFSEAISGLTAGDFSLVNGTLTGVSAEAGQVITAQLTPSGEGAVTLGLPSGVVQDAAGNGNSAAPNVSTQADLTPPTASFAALPAPVTGAFEAVLDVSEPVSGLEVSDFDLTNLTLSGITGGPQSYRLALTPQAEGAVSITLRAGSVQDAAGHLNLASAQASSTADLTGPSVALSGQAGFPGQSYSVSVVFAAPVTGFELSDFTSSNAQLSALSGGPTSYSVQVTPTDFAHQISLPQGAAVDAQGRGSLASNAVTNTPDGTRPTADLADIAQGVAAGQSETLALTFSEAVEGIATDDFTLANAVMVGVSGAAQNWSVSFTPDGVGPVTITLRDSAGQDVSGESSQSATRSIALATQSQNASNGGQGTGTSSGSGSGTGSGEDTGSGEGTPEQETTDGGAGTPQNQDNTSQATQSPSGQMVSDFLQFRSRSFVQMQPNVTPFAQNSGAGVFRANVSQGVGTLDFSTAGRGPVWATLQGVMSEDDQSASDFILAAFGTHRRVLDRAIIGMMLQFDHAETLTNAGARATGQGWMAGPYFSTQIRQHPLYLSGRLLYGQSENTLSPRGSFTDEFDGERWLAMLSLQGQARMENVTVIPRLGLSYFLDRQDAYIDGFGVLVPEQEISQSEVDLGVSMQHPIEVSRGEVTFEWGVAGVWTALAADGAGRRYLVDEEGGRARINLGGSYQSDGGLSARVMTSFDGIGAQHEFRAYGIEASVNFEF